MWWEEKIMRTFRCRLRQVPGTLGHFLSRLGEAGGDIGEIRVLRQSTGIVERDIVVFADSPAHMDRLVGLAGTVPDVELLEVRDDVLEMHQGGKIAIRSRYKIDSLEVLRKVYTPGVAEVCLRIKDNPLLARRYTCIRHFVAIVTDGTAVLGLGDIGPLAAMPVMEGKASLMETLSGLSGVPILLATKDVDAIVEAVAAIAPTFSAIQLEDISAPRCFDIETRLQERLDIPVMHDDQHGTACVVTAALINAEKVAARKPLAESRIGVVGLGAAGLAISKMLMAFTGRPVAGADLSPAALDRLVKAGGRPAGLEEIMASSDVVVAVTGAAGLIKPATIKPGQIILALSNPAPEIEPEAALKAGAAFAADGKSVNNVLGFPGIFRGAVDANVRRITQDMLIAAARAIAETAGPGEIVPNPLDRALHPRVARAVARVALEKGLNRDDLTGYFEE
ncbi:MAG: NAD(P)-dependent oxidoreductase [Acidobacteriota bacterium]|nr:NAD(P)-dependent oxidoreductase [Acidobacteriota bacterium]